jgi:hypothetical protein
MEQGAIVARVTFRYTVRLVSYSTEHAYLLKIEFPLILKGHAMVREGLSESK